MMGQSSQSRRHLLKQVIWGVSATTFGPVSDLLSHDPKFDLELCRRVQEREPEGFLWDDAIYQ
jgi:hypothetical protein